MSGTIDPAITIAANMIAQFEGFSPVPYLGPAGRTWTIGCGTTFLPDGSKVCAGTPPITIQDAMRYVENDAANILHDIDGVVTVPLNPNQTAALIDFTYNLGFGAFRSSTLLKLLNAGDISGAAEQFVRWDIAGGEQMPGLLRRREAEVALFKTPWVAPALAPSLKDT
jgi:lysozyme